MPGLFQPHTNVPQSFRSQLFAARSGDVAAEPQIQQVAGPFSRAPLWYGQCVFWALFNPLPLFFPFNPCSGPWLSFPGMWHGASGGPRPLWMSWHVPKKLLGTVVLNNHVSCLLIGQQCRSIEPQMVAFCFDQEGSHQNAIRNGLAGLRS